MDPASLLTRLRRRHGVSENFARRFFPLIERATKASPEVRRRIMELIERSFVRQSEREVPTSPLDQAVLGKVARVLHSWQPAPWLEKWSD